MAHPSQTPPKRAFKDTFLLEYSREHVAYEFGMFVWLCNSQSSLSYNDAAGQVHATNLNNVRVETFALHLRNLIDFFYLDKPQPTDIIADDYCQGDAWKATRPRITSTLEEARRRANKEVAHLTSERKFGITPDKTWDFSKLRGEITCVSKAFAKIALKTRLHPEVFQLLGS